MKFNSLQYSPLNGEYSNIYLTAQALNVNNDFEVIKKEYMQIFNLPSVQSFSFTQDKFFALFMQLNGVIRVSLGESEAIVSGAKLAKQFGADIEFLELTRDGDVDFTLVDKNCDFVFISSYVTDTYFKIDLEKVKALTNAKIVSNITAVTEHQYSDILLLDGYKLCGQGEFGVIVYDDEIEEAPLGEINISALKLCLESFKNRELNKAVKYKFLEKFEEYFSDNLYLFVDPKLCLEYTLHVGLKDIKAREIIRTMSLSAIELSNGEGCSLGLSKPSRVIQSMGYEELESRWSLSLDFSSEITDEQIDSIVKLIHKKYRQIKVLG